MFGNKGITSSPATLTKEKDPEISFHGFKGSRVLIPSSEKKSFISDEQIIETIELNAYGFLSNGEMY